MRSPKHVAVRNYSKFRMLGLVAGIEAIIEKGAITSGEEYDLRKIKQVLESNIDQWKERTSAAYNRYKILHG